MIKYYGNTITNLNGISSKTGYEIDGVPIRVRLDSDYVFGLPDEATDKTLTLMIPLYMSAPVCLTDETNSIQLDIMGMYVFDIDQPHGFKFEAEFGYIDVLLTALKESA